MKKPASPHAAESCQRNLFELTETYVREQPAKALAVAFGAGITLRLLSTKSVVRPIAMVMAKLLPPTLLGLGILRAIEMCRMAGDDPKRTTSVTNSH